MTYDFAISVQAAQPYSLGQDRAAVIQTSWGLLCALFDGAGNSNASGQLASILLQKTQDRAHNIIPSAAQDPETFYSLITELDQFAAALPGTCTAVLIAVVDGLCVGASVGSSHALLFGGDFDGIELTSSQFRHPLIGSKRARPTTFGPLPLEHTLLIASDGVTDYIPADTLGSISRDLAHDAKSTAQRLTTACALSGGALQDDACALVVRRHTQH